MCTSDAEGIGNIAWWGFSPAIDLREKAQNVLDLEYKREMNVLVVGGSDTRHILRTVAESNKKSSARTNFFLIESSLEGYARMALQLYLILEQSRRLSVQEKTELYLELFGSTLVREFTASYLRHSAGALLKFVTSLGGQESLSGVMDISPLKFKERDILEAVFKFWKKTSKEDFQITACWDQRVRKHLGTRYDSIPNVFDWDCSITLHDRQATQINSKEYERWRQKGVAFVLREAEYTSPNRSLGSGRMFTLPNGEKKVYWGYWGDITCSPYLAFGIDTSRYPDLAKTFNGQKAYGATITSEVNVRSLLWELENHHDCPLSIAAPFCSKFTNKKKQDANLSDKTGDNHESTETSKPSGSGNTEGQEETEEDEHGPDLGDGDSKAHNNETRTNSEDSNSEPSSFDDRLNNIPYAPLKLPSPFMVHMLPANCFCDLPTRFRSIFLGETPESIDVIYVGCSVAHLLDSPKLLGSQDVSSSEAGLNCTEEGDGKQSEGHESRWTYGIHDLLSSKSLLIVESILYMVQMRQAQIEAYVTRITNMASKLSFKPAIKPNPMTDHHLYFVHEKKESAMKGQD